MEGHRSGAHAHEAHPIHPAVAACGLPVSLPAEPEEGEGGANIDRPLQPGVVAGSRALAPERSELSGVESTVVKFRNYACGHTCGEMRHFSWSFATDEDRTRASLQSSLHLMVVRSLSTELPCLSQSFFNTTDRECSEYGGQSAISVLQLASRPLRTLSIPSFNVLVMHCARGAPRSTCAASL